MSHRIAESREADMTPGERLFARSVTLFDPRRGTAAGHLIAFTMGAAAMLFALWLGARA